MAKETYRIDIEIEANDNYSSKLSKAKSDVEGYESSVRKSMKKATRHTSRYERNMKGFTDRINRRMNRITRNRWEIVLRAKDHASRVIRSVSGFASRNIERTYQTTLRAVNLGGRIIRGFSRALFSLPSMITVGLGVVGVGSLGKATIGSSMNFEDYGVSMDHWLEDDTKTSKALMKWMGQKADLTPFTSADIFPAMTGAIGMVGNDPDQIKRLTSTAIDMAALTPGATVEDAMQAIRNAQMGEMTMMKRYGFNITKDDFDSMGWDGFVNEIEKRFKGGSLRLSETARGQMNTLKGYMQSQFRSMGDGILEGMKPRLESVTSWLMDNEEAWTKWKDTVEHAGRQASEWVFSKLETSFKHIRDNYLENKEFHDLDFEGKIKFIMEDIGSWWSRHGSPAVSSWWDGTGKPMAEKLGTSIGKAMVTGIAEGVKQGVSMGLNMWGDTIGTAKEHGVFSKETGSSILGAAGGTALLAGGASLLLHPLLRAGKGLFKGGKSALGGLGKGAGWLMSKLPGKGKGKATDPKGTPKHKSGPVIYDQQGNPIESRGKKQTKNQRWWNKIKKPKMPKWTKNTGRFMKRVPLIGPAVGALSILGADKDNLAKTIGEVAGGALGGMAGGAAIGSVVPGVGTIVGGIGGGIAGAFGGGKLMDWMFKPKKASASAESPTETKPSTSFEGSDQLSMISQNAQILSSYLGQASGWVVGAFHPIQNAGQKINHNVTALTTWLGEASGWVVGAFHPLQGTGQLIAHNANALSAWLGQASGWVVTSLHPLESSGQQANHNLSTLAIWLGEANVWVVSAFHPMESHGASVNHNLNALTTWTGQASNWIVSGIHPIQASGQKVNQNMNALAHWVSQASSWIVSINGVQDGADLVKLALSNLAKRISSISVKLPGMPKYAKGTNYHPGGPAIVGDGGGSELVRFPNGRTWLSPATDTMVNLPKGTQVLPHNKTKKLVNVPQYADGVGNFSAVGGAVIYGDTNNNIGDTHVTVVVENGETDDPDGLADRIADKVAGIIAEKMDEIGSNMPVTEG